MGLDGAHARTALQTARPAAEEVVATHGRSCASAATPTSGYLSLATEGKTFHDFFASVASPAADWLFMIGLLGIGLALILGIGMWIAAISGSVMLVLMWAAGLPLENNLFMDDHIIYALVLVALAIYGAGRTWGLGRTWEALPIVHKLAILK